MGLFSKIANKLLRKKKMAKKYDVIVTDIDAEGRPSRTPENGVMASSTQELINLYRMCDKKIEIVREYEDEDSRNYGKSNISNVDDFKTCGPLPSSADGLMQVSQEEIDALNRQKNSVKTNNNQVTTSVQKPTVKVAVVKEPPKFFTVGGIKCKLDNGKMYQKQWMRLNDEEASEFRIVSDKNNKICSIKDKHIEIMKWVMVEDNSEDNNETEKTMELING